MRSVPTSADGTYVFKVSATDAAGNAGARVSRTFTLSRGGAATVTVNGPMHTLDAGKALGTAQIPVKLTWSATSSGGAAIVRYKLEQSVNGGSSWMVVSTPVTATSASRMLSPNNALLSMGHRHVQLHVAGDVGLDAEPREHLAAVEARVLVMLRHGPRHALDGGFVGPLHHAHEIEHAGA